MQTFGLPLEWESTLLSLASTRYALPLERPELVVFLCFTHLPVAIPPQHSLERASTLLGKPGSLYSEITQTFAFLAANPFWHVEVDSEHFRRIERMTVIMYEVILSLFSQLLKFTSKQLKQ